MHQQGGAGGPWRRNTDCCGSTAPGYDGPLDSAPDDSDANMANRRPLPAPPRPVHRRSRPRGQGSPASLPRRDYPAPAPQIRQSHVRARKRGPVACAPAVRESPRPVTSTPNTAQHGPLSQRRQRLKFIAAFSANTHRTQVIHLAQWHTLHPQDVVGRGGMKIHVGQGK